MGTTVTAANSDGAQPTMAQRIRAVRMNTNATPGYVPPETEEKLAIPDPTDDGSAATEETKPLSPQLAAIARQRRALQVKEREIADRERALEARSSTQGDAIDKARLKSDPVGALLDAGVSYDDLTQAILANRDREPISALEAKIKALEEGVDKKFTDRETQQEQQVLAEMRREALQLVAQGDQFELVRETKSVPKAIELIERRYRETGEVWDVSFALGLIEEELIKDSLKLASLSKVQSQLAPRPAPVPNQRQPMRTLTNRDTASVPLDRKARALAAFTGTLKR